MVYGGFEKVIESVRRRSFNAQTLLWEIKKFREDEIGRKHFDASFSEKVNNVARLSRDSMHAFCDKVLTFKSNDALVIMVQAAERYDRSLARFIANEIMAVAIDPNVDAKVKDEMLGMLQSVKHKCETIKQLPLDLHLKRLANQRRVDVSNEEDEDVEYDERRRQSKRRIQAGSSAVPLEEIANCELFDFSDFDPTTVNIGNLSKTDLSTLIMGGGNRAANNVQSNPTLAAQALPQSTQVGNAQNSHMPTDPQTEVIGQTSSVAPPRDPAPADSGRPHPSTAENVRSNNEGIALSLISTSNLIAPTDRELIHEIDRQTLASTLSSFYKMGSTTSVVSATTTAGEAPTQQHVNIQPRQPENEQLTSGVSSANSSSISLLEGQQVALSSPSANASSVPVTANEMQNTRDSARDDVLALKYWDIKRIGDGQLGTIFKAYRKSDNKVIALKEIDLYSTGTIQVRVNQDLKELLPKLNHPNIIRYFGTTFISNFQILLLEMEYCAGSNLRKEINNYKEHKRQFMERIQIKLWGKQLAAAILFLHSNKVIHRDINPKNIIFKDNEHEVIKLGDFGLTQTHRAGDTPSSYFRAGTLRYMAPEILYDMPVDVANKDKADIYSLGAVLFELVTLNAPMLGFPNNIDDEHLAQFDNNMERLANFRNLVYQMLAVDANQRPSINQVLCHPWFTLDSFSQ